MGIEIPDDWPDRGWVEEPPKGTLVTVASDPVSGMPGAEPLRWPVASWETTREIAASSLPGQVRAKTGLSVGTGKAVVKRDPDDFPWKKRAVYELAGQNAQLLIAPEQATEIPTGQFQVAEISGDISTLGVQVDLDEKTIVGRDKAANVRGWSYEDAQAQPDDVYKVDPIWWISELARQIGYGTGLVPGEEGYAPYFDLPLQGSIAAAYPRSDYGWAWEDDYEWTSMQPGIVAFTNRDPSNGATIFYEDYSAGLVRSSIITLDLRNRGGFTWDALTSTAEVNLDVTNWAGYADVLAEGSPLANRVTVGLSSRGANGVFNTGVSMNFDLPYHDPERPEGIQIQLELLSSDGINWTGVRARVARTATAPWSTWVTHTATNSYGTVLSSSAEDNPWGLKLTASFSNLPGIEDNRSRISRITMVDTDMTGVSPNQPGDLWRNYQGAEGRLYLEPLLGTITSPWLDPDLTTWNAMQAVVEAWQGALITDVYGAMRVLNRLSLVGVGTGQEIPLDVGIKFEDLPWIANHSDQADRLVVRYRPARVVTVDDPAATKLPIVWEAQEIIPTNPGGNDVFFNTDYLYLMYSAQIPWVQKGSPDFNEIYHTWDAYRYSNGTGTHMQPNTHVGIRIEQVTVSTWKVYIENRTTSPFYMVDNTGTPWLKVRSFYHMDQTQESAIERGVSAGEARNPLEVDLSNYVQNDEDANALADFIWARARQRSWRADTISMVPDYRLDLGDVIELTHERTGVRSNALVTKVKMAGEPGQLTQHVDLVLIPPTWEDFDEVWAAKPGGNTWDDFDALWAPYTWNDFDRTPTATTVTEIEEAL